MVISMPPRTNRNPGSSSRAPRADAEDVSTRPVGNLTVRAGRGTGRVKRVTLNDVEEAYQKKAEQGAIKESSIKTNVGYLSATLGKMLKDAGDANWRDMEYRRTLNLNDYLFRDGGDAWMERILGWYQEPGTRKNHLGALISLADVIGSKTIKVTAKQYDKIYAEMLHNEKIATQKRKDNAGTGPNHLKWDEAVDAEKKLRNNPETYATAQHVALALFVLIPPRRGTDYVKLKHVRQKPPLSGRSRAGNFVIVPNDSDSAVSLDIRSYKTANTYGPFQVSLVPDADHAKFFQHAKVLGDILRDYCAGLRVNQLLFANERGEANDAYFHSLVKNALEAATGRFAGVRELRRAYVTQIYIDEPLTTNQYEDLAFLMGHKLEQQMTYRIHEDIAAAYQDRQQRAQDMAADIDELADAADDYEAAIRVSDARLSQQRDTIKKLTEALTEIRDLITRALEPISGP